MQFRQAERTFDEDRAEQLLQIVHPEDQRNLAAESIYGPLERVWHLHAVEHDHRVLQQLHLLGYDPHLLATCFQPNHGATLDGPMSY